MGHTYTAFVRWNNDPYSAEEVDVVAHSFKEAAQLAAKELDADYEPGWEIFDVVQRANGCFFL